MNDTSGSSLMRQVFLSAPGIELSVREIPIARPSAREVLVKINVATVCAGTDLAIMAGLHPPHDPAVAGMLPHELRLHLGNDAPDSMSELYPQHGYQGVIFPTTMGHEAAGTILALGPEANHPEALAFDGKLLSVGDRVATFQIPGGYGEYSCLPSSNVVKIPEFMTDDEGSLLEPLLLNYNCLRKCWALQEPATVAVLGQGFQGLLATQVVRALGSKLVIVSEPLPYKRRLALELGADVALDPQATNIVHEVERLTRGQGVDLVVECVGIEETVRIFPYLVKRTGMVAQIGAVTTPVTFDYGYVHFKNFMIMPCDRILSFRQVADQVAEIIDLIKNKTINLRELVTHRFELGNINSAFQLLRDQAEEVVKVAIDVRSLHDPSQLALPEPQGGRGGQSGRELCSAARCRLASSDGDA
jgi:threonine dehydrogenase-like Zn-dependent dehydrogenase